MRGGVVLEFRGSANLVCSRTVKIESREEIVL
jgi:hypothetical protein